MLRLSLVLVVAALVLSACATAPTPPAALAAATAPAPAETAVAPAVSDAAEPSAPSPCMDDPTRRAFDFWVGHWTVESAAGKVIGHNEIARTERGCALIEHWRGGQGSSGTSINYVDPVDGAWVQLWVDAGGGVISLRGGRAGDAMALEGQYTKPTGDVSRLRGSWTPLADGRVRQQFDESTDEGRTWSVWFDGYYRRAPR